MGMKNAIGFCVMVALCVATSLTVKSWYRGGPVNAGRLVVRELGPSEARPGSPPTSSDVIVELTNEGGQPVQVLDVSTTCGCASAAVEPKQIPPRGLSYLTIRFDPIEVGVRRVLVTVKTDSPTAPVLLVETGIVGHRDPPYIVKASGDLCFRSSDSVDDAQPLFVETVESAESEGGPPRLSCRQEAVQIGPAKRIREAVFDPDPSFVVRGYEYPIRLDRQAVTEDLDDFIEVSASWDRGGRLRVPIHADPVLSLRAIPERLVLARNGEEAAAVGRFAILGANDPDRLRIQADDGFEDFVTIKAVDARPGGGDLPTFEVRIAPDAPVLKTDMRIVVESPEGRLVVPVALGGERRP